MKHSSSTVTIIIPTRDRPSMLKRAVSSALVAARPWDQIIVVDDGSDTPAEQVVGPLSDLRLTVVRSRGCGPAAARNAGIEAAQGEHVFFVDDDDEMLPDYVSYVVDSVLTARPRPSFGYSGIITERVRRGKIRQRLRLPSRTGVYAAPRFFEPRLHGFGMGFWARKEVFSELGPISDELWTNEDTEFFLRLMASDYLGWFAPRAGVVVHKHNGGPGELGHLTERSSTENRLQAFQVIASTHAALIEKDPVLRLFVQRKLIRLALKSGDINVARAALRCADLRGRAYFWAYAAAFRLTRRRSI